MSFDLSKLILRLFCIIMSSRHNNSLNRNNKSLTNTHQPKHNEEDLDDVSVGDGDETPEKGVAQGDDGRHDDRDLLVDVEDDLKSGSQGAEDGGGPEDLGDGGWEGLQGAPLAVLLSEGVHHRHVLGVPHDSSEKRST